MRNHYVLDASWLLAALTGIGVPALAQTAAPGTASDSLEEVIVTALKEKTSLQKTPSSVDVVSNEQLIDRGVTDLRGLTNFTPLVELNKESTTTQVFIRGIGQSTDTDTTSPAVAVNFDGVYNPRFSLGTSFFDVAQVEILPGPQGTLYGRNAAGGTVNVATRAPGDTYKADVLFEIGNYSLFHSFVGVDVPISDQLKIRAAIDNLSHKGYLSNGLDDGDDIAGRLTAVYTPNDALSVLLRAEFNHSGGLGDGVVPYPFVNPKNPWYDPTAPGDNFHNRRVVDKTNAEIKYALDKFTITYIPAFIYLDNVYRAPISAPVPTPNDPTTYGATGEFAAGVEAVGQAGQQISNELRITSNNADKGAGSISYVGGLYQLYSDGYGPGGSFEVYNPAVFSGGSETPYLVRTGGGQDYGKVIDHSYAVFGQVSYSLLDWLRMTGGGRYSNDIQHATGTLQTYLPATPTSVIPFTQGALVDYNGITATAPTFYNLNLTKNHTDWKIGLEADVTPTSLVYGNVQTGYIQGGFNLIPEVPGQPAGSISGASTFLPETLLAYTVGSKNTFLNGRVRLNTEAFYYDYKNLQVSAFNAASGATSEYNVNKSVIYGDQLDLAYRLFKATTFDAGVGYLKGTVKDAILPPATVYAVGPPELTSGTTMINYSGLDLPDTPRISASASLAQSWELGNGATLEGLVGTHYQAVSSSLFSVHIRALQYPAYTKTDVSLTYHSAGGTWSIAGWVKNAENSARGISPGTDGIYGQAPRFIDPPRTFGLRLELHLGQ
jgi:iron complex outermembrane recepter protein